MASDVNTLLLLNYYVILLLFFFLAHLSMLMVSFWDRVMSLVRVDVRAVRPSSFCLCSLKRAQFLSDLHETLSEY